MTHLQKKTHIETALAVISAKHNAKLKLSLSSKTDYYSISCYSISCYVNSHEIHIHAWLNARRVFTTLNELYKEFFKATSILEFHDINNHCITINIVDEVGLTFEETKIVYDLLS